MQFVVTLCSLKRLDAQHLIFSIHSRLTHLAEQWKTLIYISLLLSFMDSAALETVKTVKAWIGFFPSMMG